jgi:S-adenosylmethionine hydrolase
LAFTELGIRQAVESRNNTYDMIVLFTDFGWQGPYVGQMKTVLAQHAPHHPVIDLMHDVPAFKPCAAAYLLASLVEKFSVETVFLTVVDPGVGSSQRRPCVVNADGRWFVGPDNGLFNVIARQATTYKVWEIDWRPDFLSESFHGRDLFAPVAAQLACGRLPHMTRTSLVDSADDWPAELAEIIYLDHFGNAMSGLRGSQTDPMSKLKINQHIIPFARVFAEVQEGAPFWYQNSNGLVEIAINQGNAAQLLGLEIGMSVLRR